MTLARSLEKTAGGQDTSWSSGKKQNAAQVVRAKRQVKARGRSCVQDQEKHRGWSDTQRPAADRNQGCPGGGWGVLVGPRATAERPPASPVTRRHTALPGAAAQQGEGGQGNPTSPLTAHLPMPPTSCARWDPCARRKPAVREPGKAGGEDQSLPRPRRGRTRPWREGR